VGELMDLARGKVM
jgi:hypothetical protein